MTHLRSTWLLRRRAVLRGAAGAAIGLPFLDAMVAPRRARAAGPQRFIVWFVPGAVSKGLWRRQGASETAFTLGGPLAALEPVRQHLLFLEGLNLSVLKDDPTAQNHPAGAASVLTGEIPGVPAPSLDAVIAARIGGATRFRSVDLGINSSTSGDRSKPTDGSNVSDHPIVSDPQTAFNRLFSDLGTDAAALARLRARSKSILDGAAAQYARLAARVGAADRLKLEQHLAQVRDLENRLGAAGMSANACSAPDITEALKPGQAPPGAMPPPIDDATERRSIDYAWDSRTPAVGKVMMDMMIMAFRCDLTRVGQLHWSDFPAYNTFPWLGLYDTHHGYQHNRGYQADAINKITTWYMQQFRYLVDGLAAVQEIGGGSVLDGTAVLWVSEIAEPESHSWNNMPFLLAGRAGGALRPGRWLKYADLPHNQLHLALARTYGVPGNTFGRAKYCPGPLADLG